MPYQTIEQLGNRGYEKISQFLTVQNLFGIAACVLPGLAIIEAVSNLVMRAIILVLLAALGYLLTTEMDGMAPYQRLLWRLRGFSRGFLRGRTLAPEDLPGTAIQSHVPIDWSGSLVRRKTAPSAVVAELAYAGSRSQNAAAGARVIAQATSSTNTFADHPAGD